MKDLYFEKNYGKLNEDIEKGKVEVFEYKSDLGQVHHMFIKRVISGTNNKWYDLTTPYGYGGPIILECASESNKNKLTANFEKKFTTYCQENNIVSEFIRFHPIVDNASDFEHIYDVSFLRKTIGTDLENTDDPFQDEFSKSCRKKVRRSLRDGVEFEIHERPSDLSEFTNIYYDTMDRNNASDYYYFDLSYFNKFVEYYRDNLLLVKATLEGKTIAAGFYFLYGDYIHIHLSGTLHEYLNYSPAYVLRYAVIQWGYENGYKIVHHGGGRSNSEDDSLYTFKKRFGSMEFDFKIGKKIWNPEIYDQLIQNSDQTDYFPAYRNK